MRPRPTAITNLGRRRIAVQYPAPVPLMPQPFQGNAALPLPQRRNRMSDEDDEALEARRARLAAALESVKRQTPPSALPASPSDNTAAAMSMGLRAGSEFVAAVVMGGAIGWGLDWLLHTKPAFTIVFFLFGVAAGVLAVI